LFSKTAIQVHPNPDSFSDRGFAWVFNRFYRAARLNMPAIALQSINITHTDCELTELADRVYLHPV